MATTNINVRVDSALKQEAEALFNDLGLSMSSAITMFLRSAINHDGIPFEIKRPVPNAETRAALCEYEEMKKIPAIFAAFANAILNRTGFLSTVSTRTYSNCFCSVP